MELSRIARTAGFAVLAYVGFVVVFETLLGVLQPETGDTIVITTTDANGVSADRVLGRDFAGGRRCLPKHDSTSRQINPFQCNPKLAAIAGAGGPSDWETRLRCVRRLVGCKLSSENRKRASLPRNSDSLCF